LITPPKFGLYGLDPGFDPIELQPTGSTYTQWCVDHRLTRHYRAAHARSLSPLVQSLQSLATFEITCLLLRSEPQTVFTNLRVYNSLCTLAYGRQFSCKWPVRVSVRLDWAMPALRYAHDSHLPIAANCIARMAVNRLAIFINSATAIKGFVATYPS